MSSTCPKITARIGAQWVPEAQQATYALPAEWSGRFDLITAHFVLEHVAAPVPVLADLAPASRPAGGCSSPCPTHLATPETCWSPTTEPFRAPRRSTQPLRRRGCTRPRCARTCSAARMWWWRSPAPARPRRQTPRLRWRYWPNGSACSRPWRRCPPKARGSPSTARAFYGALFAPRLGAGLVAFLEPQPASSGRHPSRSPDPAAQACPPVDLVVAALNPARARAILPPDAPWPPQGARILYPGDPQTA